MNITDYLASISSGITNSNLPKSISNAEVGAGFSDLATLTKTNVEAVNATTTGNTATIAVISGQTSGNTASIATLNTTTLGIQSGLTSAIAFGGAKIHVDRTLNQVVIPKFYYTKKGGAYTTKAATDYGSSSAFTFALQLSGSILDTIIFDPTLMEQATSLNPFYIESTAQINTLKPRSIIIAQMIGGIVTSSFNITDDADTAAVANKDWNKQGQLVGYWTNYTLDYNTTTFNLTFTAGASTTFVGFGANFYSPVSGVTALVDTRTSGQGQGINHLVFSLLDNKFYLVSYLQQALYQNNNYIWLGSMLNANIQYSQIQGNFTVNGAGKTYAPTPGSSSIEWNKIGTLIGQSYGLNYENTGYTVTLSGGVNALFIGSGAKYYTPVTGTTDFVDARVDVTKGTGINHLVFSTLDNKIYGVRYLQQAAYQNNNYVYLGSFFNANVQSSQVLGNFTINGFSKQYIASGSTNPTATNELVLPPKIWMLTGEKLPFYKSSIIRSTAELTNDVVLACPSTSTTDFNFPTYNSVDDNFILDPANLKTAVTFYSKNYTDTANDYGVNVQIKTSAVTAKSGLTKTWFCWGDSLTNRGVALYTKNYLSTVGAGLTLNNYGTMMNGGVPGEGREGWTFLNFIGADNTHLGDNTAITLLPTGTTTGSTIYSNPFLRLATSADTTAHPTWCFRNTGANAELSYSTDTGKTGNFYIFDPAYYAAQFVSGNTPDLITIALSTNDITENVAAGVTNSLFGLTIMLTQIRAAFPSVKIGIIPATGQGDNSIRWTNICDWINQLNQTLATLALTNVEIIGIWMHLNKHFTFPYLSNSNLRSDGNLTKAYVKSEAIHFGQDGYLPYGKALGAYIVNVI